MGWCSPPCLWSHFHVVIPGQGILAVRSSWPWAYLRIHSQDSQVQQVIMGSVFFPHFPAETWHFCTILGPEGQTHYLGCTEANLGWTWLDRSNTSPGRKRLDNQTRPPTSAHQFQLRRGHGGPVLLEAKGQRRSENREETDHRNNSIRPNPMFVHVSSCF